MNSTPPALSARSRLMPSIRPQSRTQTASQPPRLFPLMRRYEVTHLRPNGDLNDFVRIGPAHPAFENAFAAFARGTLFQTSRGAVAVEDLLPGDTMMTADGRSERLLWKGSVMLVPNLAGQSAEMTHLTRMAAESMGLSRPSQDLIVGSAARVLHRGPGVVKATGQRHAFVPVSDFVDSVNVVELTPISTVQLFHLGCAGQERLLANGIEVESQHPGPVKDFPLRADLLTLYLSFFPHVRDLRDFYHLAIPRLRLSDLDIFDAA